MRAIVQRVTQASVTVESDLIGAIGPGLLVFLGVHRDDTAIDAETLSRKVLQLRIFPDNQGKMNRSLLDTGTSLLVISQFTLFGDTTKGNRPSYTTAASPEHAKQLYQHFINSCSDKGVAVVSGKFQAHMRVHLVNDGPVTLLFDTKTHNVL